MIDPIIRDFIKQRPLFLKDFLLQKKRKHFYLVPFASASFFNGEKWLDNVII
jgi:hypothetical protein